MPLLQAKELHIEDEDSVGGDEPGVALFAVSIVGGADELGTLTN